LKNWVEWGSFPFRPQQSNATAKKTKPEGDGHAKINTISSGAGFRPVVGRSRRGNGWRSSMQNFRRRLSKKIQITKKEAGIL
jgi:hypothetical protein